MITIGFRRYHGARCAFVVLLLAVTTFPHHYQTLNVDWDDVDDIQKDDDDKTARTTRQSFDKDALTRLRNCSTYTDNEDVTNKTTDAHTNDPLKSKLFTTESEKIDGTKDAKLTNNDSQPVNNNYTGSNNNGRTLGSTRLENAHDNVESRDLEGPEQKMIDDAVEYGLKKMHDLYFVKEPELYRMGMFLESNHPGYLLASFRQPNEKALNYARYGYAAVQAKTKLAELYPESIGRESSSLRQRLKSDLLLDLCPVRGFPRCPAGSDRYRTADGTCNNLQNPWRGASMMPMQRFLPPHYEDGVQTVRNSITGKRLPSPREISTTIHRDKNHELPTVTLMFMQWGQFLDHDITSSVQARMFNRSVPRCCQEGGRGFLHPELTHPDCLPISVPENDSFLNQFGVRCIEFVRSAPTTRINCDLGFREQISQVTAYIDASTVYGSDSERADSLRLFRRGQLIYGRSSQDGPLQPPDPPVGELCRLGAITTDCFRGGDSRFGDQPGLTALHTIWLRFHNYIAHQLSGLNARWSDEKTYQEARRIVGALIQHISYHEFLPIVLGDEVMRLFGLNLERSGYYKGYSPKVNPAPANSFGTAAFRFGHSLVQNSFVRRDAAHRVIRNNVTLHKEQDNVENIWSFGSIDRLLLGMCSQPTQRRDEFICKELTNHLFQTSDFSFGMDLAAINIQRGRDHGLPSYTSWREPCGLIPLSNWTDLERVMPFSTVQRFKSLYEHIHDIDLFSGGLAERPVRGGIVGPTFACIIAQQFLNLRKGDRFWYENGNAESSFTPAQLQQIRKVTFALVLCKATTEMDTIQPFVFLTADNIRNVRVSCNDPSLDNLDLSFWKEKHGEDDGNNLFLARSGDDSLEDYDDDDIEDRANKNKKRNKLRLKIKTTSVPGRRRPTVKKRRPSSPKIPQRQTVSYKPFKVKITNVSTVITNSNKNHVDNRPSYHSNNVYPSTSTPLLVNGPGGYVLDELTNPTNNENIPYHVNINIQLIPPDGQNQDYEYSYVGTRQTTPMTIIKLQPSRRPVHVSNSFNYDQMDYRNQYVYNNVVTKGPSPPQNPYYEDISVPIRRPLTETVKPIHRPLSETSIPIHRPLQDNSIPIHRPLQDSSIPIHRPLTETVFENAPFATSGIPHTNNYNYFKHSTMKPVIIPSYLYLNEQDENGYKLYDATPRPTIHYILNSYKDITKFRPTYYNNYESADGIFEDERKPFVKISSVHGHKQPTYDELKRPVYISVHQREGDDLNLPDDDQTPSPLLKVDITPSETQMHEWEFYNETDYENDPLDVSDFFDLLANDEHCSKELPRPFVLDDI